MTISLPHARVRQINIKVGGSALSQTIMNQLVDVEVESSLYLPAMFMIRFHDDKFELIDSKTFSLGAEVEVLLDDYDDALQTVIKGEITSIEPEFTDDSQMTFAIFGYDRSHRLNRGTETQAYLNSSDSDIVQRLAQKAGLSTDVTNTPVVREHVIQDNQSDLAFLQELARLNEYLFYVADGTLYFHPLSHVRSGSPPELEWGSNLVSFLPRASLACQVDEVSVQGWDQKQKQAITGRASTSRNSSPEIGLGASGGSLAKTAFGTADRLDVRLPIKDASAAQKLAQAILNRLNGEFVEAVGVAMGHPAILAGCKLELKNLGTRFSGKYRITSARHIYEPGDYRTEFRVEGVHPKAMFELGGTDAQTELTRRWWGVVPAQVTNLNDPDELGRVKVQYPWLDDQLESDWARIAAPGAGAERGFQWFPEINDEVLVAFGNGDFNQPYIIGSLWSSTDKPPETQSTAVVDGKVEVRTIKTRAGHVIRLTDTEGSEMIEIIDAKEKTSLVMDAANESITLTSTKEIVLKGTTNIKSEAGSNLSIEAKSNVDIKATANVNIEASGSATIKSTSNMTVEGAAGLNVKTSGILNIEGSVVNIKGQMVKIN